VNDIIFKNDQWTVTRDGLTGLGDHIPGARLAEPWPLRPRAISLAGAFRVRQLA